MASLRFCDVTHSTHGHRPPKLMNGFKLPSLLKQMSVRTMMLVPYETWTTSDVGLKHKRDAKLYSTRNCTGVCIKTRFKKSRIFISVFLLPFGGAIRKEKWNGTALIHTGRWVQERVYDKTDRMKAIVAEVEEGNFNFNKNLFIWFPFCTIEYRLVQSSSASDFYLTSGVSWGMELWWTSIRVSDMTMHGKECDERGMRRGGGLVELAGKGEAEERKKREGGCGGERRRRRGWGKVSHDIHCTYDRAPPGNDWSSFMWCTILWDTLAFKKEMLMNARNCLGYVLYDIIHGME